MILANNVTDSLVGRLIYGIILLWEVTLTNLLYQQICYDDNTSTEQT